jgi:FkbM family methyltransferase
MAYFAYKRGLETTEYRRIVQLAGPGALVVDAGANIGFFTMELAKQVGPNGRVIAIEPDRVNFNMLQRNMDRAGLAERCILVNAAVSSRTGLAQLAIDHHHPANHRLGDSGPEVKLHTIDELVSKYGNGQRVALIKLDIQGSEVDALRGAGSTMSRDRPEIAFEIDPSSLAEFEYTTQDLLDEVLRHDYQIEPLTPNPIAVTLAPDPNSYGDYLARPRESLTPPTDDKQGLS